MASANFASITMNKLIEPYNPGWAIAFEEISQVLRTALHDFTINIEHVGSTAVPGRLAKPIVDIDIIVYSKNQLAATTASLEKIGYASKGEQGITGRFAFRQTTYEAPLTNPKNKWQTHHLYVCYADSLALKNHLLFRDALRKEQDLRHQYAALKKALAGDSAVTKTTYAARKTAFIISVLTRAGLTKNELAAIMNANV